MDRVAFNKIVGKVYFEKTGNEKLPVGVCACFMTCADVAAEEITEDNLAEWLKENWPDIRVCIFRHINNLPLPDKAILRPGNDIEVKGERVRTHFITGPGLSERTVLNLSDLDSARVAIMNDPARELTLDDVEKMLDILER